MTEKEGEITKFRKFVDERMNIFCLELNMYMDMDRNFKYSIEHTLERCVCF